MKLCNSLLRLIALLLYGCAFSSVSIAYADGDKVGDALLPKSIGILDQSVVVPFDPVSIYALQELSVGAVQQFRAIALQAFESNSKPQGESRTLIAGAAVPLSPDISPSTIFHYAFFLTDLSGQFAATEVKSTAWKNIIEGQKTVSQLEQEAAGLKDQLMIEELKNSSIEKQLAELREQASKIADVDEIIDLKSELANLQGSDEQKAAETERLRELVKVGRALPEPAGIDSIRANLSLHLEAAARVGASVDRAAATKREDIIAGYKRKLALIRTTDNENPEALAQELLTLRKHRKELESSSGLSSAEKNSEF